jgi:hypothetical protein
VTNAPIRRSCACQWLMACTVLAAPATGQKLFESVNETTNPSFAMTGAAWFAHKRSSPLPLTLTAAEFLLINWNAPSVTLEVGIWDEEPATGAPRTLLGSGSFVLPQDVPGYYGARFDTAVQLPAGNYFVAVRMPNAIVAFARQGSTRTPYWFGNTPTWTGPVNGFGISFRVYAGTHPGQATSFGTGKSGVRGLVPELDGMGWPNTTNPFGFRMTHTAVGVPCLFLLGLRTAVVTPLGTLYATPLITIPATTRSDGTLRGDGFAQVQLGIPNDPSLSGGRLAAQVMIADAAATFGIAHTPGLEVVIGH